MRVGSMSPSARRHSNDTTVRALLEASAKRLVDDFLRRAKAVKHPGSRGTIREDSVRSFLQDHLPRRFGIGTGFAVDAGEHLSRQIDVVIYDQLVGTVLPLAKGEGIFPIESVCGTGEVKSAITKRTLEDALDNLKSVKALDKTAGGTNLRLLGGGMAAGHYTSEDYHDGVLGFVLGWSSLRRETLGEIIMSWCANEPRRHWPNVVCVPNRGIFFWKTAAHGVDYNALGAEHLAISTNLSERDTILWFLAIASAALASSHVATFHLNKHMRLSPIQPIQRDVREVHPKD